MDRSTAFSTADPQDRVVGLTDVLDAFAAVAPLTPRRVAVIGVIVATAGRKIEQREIARQAGGVSLGTVAAVLAILREIGAVTSSGGWFNAVTGRRTRQLHRLARVAMALPAISTAADEQDSRTITLAGREIRKAAAHDGLGSPLAALLAGSLNRLGVRESEGISPPSFPQGAEGTAYGESYRRRRERDRIAQLVVELGAQDGDAEARQLIGYAVLHRIDPTWVADRVAAWVSELRHARGVRRRWPFGATCIWREVRSAAA